MQQHRAMRRGRPRARHAAGSGMRAGALWLLSLIVLYACFGAHSAAAVDVMGAALEHDAAATADSPRRTPSLSSGAADKAVVTATPAFAAEPARVDSLQPLSGGHTVDARGADAAQDMHKHSGTDKDKRSPEKPKSLPKLGAELSPEQLAAIGVTTSPLDSALRGAGAKTPKKVPASASASATKSVTDVAAAAIAADTKRSDTNPIAPRTSVVDGETLNKTDKTAPQAAANVSIDHVEAHLQILQQLELSVAQSIDEMNAKMGSRTTRRSGESRRISKELQVLQSNLKKLAESLNGTLSELVVVEKDSEQKSKQLQEVLEQQQEDAQEQFIEENGMKVVDYETGHIRNTTGLSSLQLQKLEAAEKKVDPAVLHYDFELLAQIAVLLGVAAIGGIVATYCSVPPNVGYLLGGALVGPSCLGLVRQFKEVETLSLFGSIFLLFGHGAGYTPQKLDDQFRQYFVGGMAYITSIVTLVAIVSVYIGWSSSFGEGLIIGVAVCFTTTAPLYEYIRANQIHESSYGRTLTAIIAVQDVLMSFALGTPEWFSSRSVGWIGVAAVRSIVSYGIVVLLAYALHAHVIPRLLRFLVAMEQVHHSPLVLLGVVSVCLFMALFTESIGLSLECGAFFAGLAFVNASSDAKAAFTSIRVMENLFGSMFFACVGMILNPMFLLKNAVEILSMVALIVVIKTLSMTVVMTFFDVKIEKALLAAVGLCQIGELALIFMIKAHATKLVPRRIYLLFVAAIAVFLGCSSIFNRQVLLARRKTVFRLPSIMRRAHLDDDAKSSSDGGGSDSGDVSARFGSGSGFDVESSSGDAFSTGSTPRRKSTKVVLT